MTQETTHTPGLLEKTGINGVHKRISENYATCIATTHGDNRDSNAARIVACWNACEGMADPAAEIAALRAENARLNKHIDKLHDMMNQATLKKMFGEGGKP